MTLRCPYCRASVDAGDAALCPRCRAPHHPACGVELGRCAACAGALAPAPPGEGWEAVELQPGGAPAYVRREPRRLPPPGEGPGPLELRLDLVRRELVQGDLLAGQATLTLRAPALLGALALHVDTEQVRAGLLRPRRSTRSVLRLPLLAPEGPRSWGARLLGLPRQGLHAPGSVRVAFRAPLRCAPTVDAPGGGALRRVVAALVLTRGGAAPVRVAVELRVAPAVAAAAATGAGA